MNSGSWKSKEMIRLILSIVLLAIGIILLMAPNTAMAVIVVIIGLSCWRMGLFSCLQISQGATAGMQRKLCRAHHRNYCRHTADYFPRWYRKHYPAVYHRCVGDYHRYYEPDGVIADQGLQFVVVESGADQRTCGAGGWYYYHCGYYRAVQRFGIMLGVCLTIYGILSLVSWGLVSSAKK